MLRRGATSTSSSSSIRKRRADHSLVGGEKKSSKSDALEKHTPAFGIRKVYFPMFLISTQAIEHNRLVTRNTAECTFDMKDCPMNIPTYAQNIYAYVVQATVPRKDNTSGSDTAQTGRTSLPEADFVRGGRGVDGKPNQALMMRDGNINNNVAEMGSNAMGTTADCKVRCTDNLKGDGVNQIRIRWVDEFRNLKIWEDTAASDATDVPTEDNRYFKWSLTIMIEWEEPIDLSRLMDTGTETKFR